MYKLYSIFLGGAMALATMTGVSGVANAGAIINSDTSVTVFGIDDEFGVDYFCTGENCGGEGFTPETMSGMSFWTVSAFSDTSITFDILIMNTSVDDNPENRITQFGVKILSPDPTSATVTNSGIDPDWDAATDTTFPTFFLVDLIVFDDTFPSAHTGVHQGESDTLSLTLSGFSGLDTYGLTLEIFPIKWQGVGDDEQNDSFEFGGTLKRTEIPEPGTLALFGMGLLGLAAMGRRRRRAA